VTIDASDASGNPLNAALTRPFGNDPSPSGLALATSSAPSGHFEAGDIDLANLISFDGSGSDPAALWPGDSALLGNPSPVPEPFTLALALLAVLGQVSTQFARHHFRRQTV
jgi:hypothetical protein